MDRRRFVTSSLLAALSSSILDPLHMVAASCEVQGAPRVRRPLDASPLRANKLYLIGDWGARSALQRKVAEAMAVVAQESGSPLAIVSTGDNIYPNGVESAEDPLWKSTFENVYFHPAVQVPWIAVLGNHDYRRNPQAQIDYGKRNVRWIMPHRYYRHVVTGNDGVAVEIVAIDTQQLLQRNDGWKQQMEWVLQVLQTKTTAWRIVVGHHPLRSYGHYGDTPYLVQHLLPLLQRGAVDVYASGHDHDQQIVVVPNDGVVSLVTGAGGGCRSTRWGEHTVAAATNGGFSVADFASDKLRLSLVSAEGRIMGTHTISAR